MKSVGMFAYCFFASSLASAFLSTLSSLAAAAIAAVSSNEYLQMAIRVLVCRCRHDCGRTLQMGTNGTAYRTVKILIGIRFVCFKFHQLNGARNARCVFVLCLLIFTVCVLVCVIIVWCGAWHIYSAHWFESVLALWATPRIISNCCCMCVFASFDKNKKNGMLALALCSRRLLAAAVATAFRSNSKSNPKTRMEGDWRKKTKERNPKNLKNHLHDTFASIWLCGRFLWQSISFVCVCSLKNRDEKQIEKEKTKKNVKRHRFSDRNHSSQLKQQPSTEKEKYQILNCRRPFFRFVAWFLISPNSRKLAIFSFLLSLSLSLLPSLLLSFSLSFSLPVAFSARLMLMPSACAASEH